MPSKWYIPQVKRYVQALADQYVDDKAHQVLDNAQRNVEANDQIDTGFLRDSGYVVSEVSNTHGSVPVQTKRYSTKTGQLVERASVEVPPPRPKDGAIVGFSAEYATDQELENSFLWRAVEQTAQEGDR